jgi:hypothetical protein
MLDTYYTKIRQTKPHMSKPHTSKFYRVDKIPVAGNQPVLSNK